ncbi:hypothetical protein QJS64_20580 (plasmid) [Paraclostridium bifermentans]|uniref:Helix-turn-helix domain-containing protein n=1 Tax=Paraclostridium bifermentans TaxID=1490 RepID=A0ABY8R9A2_PARBF|nr:hypothetical protein QJS64_20580 [Paraclostridium bifermentans]
MKYKKEQNTLPKDILDLVQNTSMVIISIKQLSTDYFLSESSIRRILYSYKKNKNI